VLPTVKATRSSCWRIRLIRAVGQRSNRVAADALHDSALRVIEIGDCLRPARVTEAVFFSAITPDLIFGFSVRALLPDWLQTQNLSAYLQWNKTTAAFALCPTQFSAMRATARYVTSCSSQREVDYLEDTFKNPSVKTS
jgi:hypothetical protein